MEHFEDFSLTAGTNFLYCFVILFFKINQIEINKPNDFMSYVIILYDKVIVCENSDCLLLQHQKN
jgi:hypothetical protein